MSEEPTICAKCKHGHVTGSCLSLAWCDASDAGVDVVTGEALFQNCREKNDGACPEFARGRPCQHITRYRPPFYLDLSWRERVRGIMRVCVKKTTLIDGKEVLSAEKGQG